MTSYVEPTIYRLRERLAAAFSASPAVPGTTPGVPSAGHCAAVALIVRAEFGGELVSTTFAGVSHWHNRVPTPRGPVDVDLTGDQFGLAPVRVGAAGSLFDGGSVRRLDGLLAETIWRAIRLAKSAGLDRHARELRREFGARTGGDRPVGSLSPSEPHALPAL